MQSPSHSGASASAARLVVVAALFALVDGASRNQGSKSFLQESISPELHPETDKGWSEDYPKDHQPVAKQAFGYPYPIMQDSGDFDKDYVKDENGDNGEWKAQFSYDKLRTGIGEQKDKMKESTSDMLDAWKKLEAAKKAHAEAQGDSQKTEEEAKEASDAADEADKKVKDLIGDAAAGGANGTGAGGANGTDGTDGAGGANGTDGSAIGGKVGEGVHEVEKSVNGLKDCQEQLAKARADLEKALEDKKKKEAAAKEAAKDQAERDEQDKANKLDKEARDFEDEKQHNISDKEHDLEKAQNATDAVDMDESELTKAEKASADAKARVEELEKRLKQEEADAAKAEADYDKQTKELETTEAEISTAADKLRKLRKADSGGGVYSTPPKKSGAVTPMLSGLLLSLLCAFALR